MRRGGSACAIDAPWTTGYRPSQVVSSSSIPGVGIAHLGVGIIKWEGQGVIGKTLLVLFDLLRPAKMIWVFDDAIDKATLEHNLAETHSLLSQIMSL